MNQVPQAIINRKGPRSSKELDPEVVDYLNKGWTETKNLIEWLATDQLLLLKNVLEPLDKMEWYSSFKTGILAQKKPTANSNTRFIGENFGLTADLHFIREHLASHMSDVVRCWACWAESLQYDDTQKLLSAIQPYAADHHFGVREVVIFSSKERLTEDLDKSIDILTGWTSSEDENIRRYAIEALRPIGVWTKKIAEFQHNPQKALPLLEPLKSDSSKYVP